MSPVPSSSSSPKDLISTTLVKYTNLTGKNLVNDPLAAQIKPRGSPITGICSVFEMHAAKFDDRVILMRCLNVIVDNLQDLSTIPAINEVAGLQAVCFLK